MLIFDVLIDVAMLLASIKKAAKTKQKPDWLL